MESLKETDFAKIQDKIEIISTDDEKIKIIGNLLNNDSSRMILQLLFENEMTANEIAQKTGMLLSLVIHYLQKMQGAGMVKITKIQKNTKGHDMKYYASIKHILIIFPSKLSDKAKKNKLLTSSITKILRFSSIGIAGVISWLLTNSIQEKPTHGGMIPSEPSINFIIFTPLIVVIVGLIIERIITEFRNKKS